MKITSCYDFERMKIEQREYLPDKGFFMVMDEFIDDAKVLEKRIGFSKREFKLIHEYTLGELLQDYGQSEVLLSFSLADDSAWRYGSFVSAKITDGPRFERLLSYCFGFGSEMITTMLKNTEAKTFCSTKVMESIKEPRIIYATITCGQLNVRKKSRAAYILELKT